MTIREGTRTTQMYQGLNVQITFNETSASTPFPPSVEHRSNFDAQARTCTEGHRHLIERDYH